MTARKMSDSSVPRYSIIMETENLATTAKDGLLRSLDSLQRQDLPISEAEEVILLDSGDTPVELVRTIEQRYPWLRVVRLASDVNYYGAKLAGVEATSGDVVIFADSDCVYSPRWLRSIVQSFLDDDVSIVGGETMISEWGPYALANHLAFFFDGFSSRRSIYPTLAYFANNFACRRALLDQYPIPKGLSLFRGACAMHRGELLRNGVTIWCHPEAKAHHAPPEVSSFVWRYLLIGRDKAVMKAYLRNGEVGPPKYSIGRKLISKFRSVLIWRPMNLVWLPIALPIAATAVGLILVGNLVTRNRVDFLFGFHRKLENRAVEV